MTMFDCEWGACFACVRCRQLVTAAALLMLIAISCSSTPLTPKRKPAGPIVNASLGPPDPRKATLTKVEFLLGNKAVTVTWPSVSKIKIKGEIQVDGEAKVASVLVEMMCDSHLGDCPHCYLTDLRPIGVGKLAFEGEIRSPEYIEGYTLYMIAFDESRGWHCDMLAKRIKVVDQTRPVASPQADPAR